MQIALRFKIQLPFDPLLVRPRRVWRVNHTLRSMRPYEYGLVVTPLAWDANHYVFANKFEQLRAIVEAIFAGRAQ